MVMSDARIALVTGANQGLGFALAAGLAARMDPEDLVLLTGRHARRVADAAAAVSTRAETRSRVIGRVLDVADAGAVAGLAKELADRDGGVDIVISNAIAALTPGRPQHEQADEFIDVANGGTHAVLRSFGPCSDPAAGSSSWPARWAHSATWTRACTRCSTGPRWRRSRRRSSRGGKLSTTARPRNRAGPAGSTCPPRWPRSPRSGRSPRGAGRPTWPTGPSSPRSAPDWWTPGRPGPGSTTTPTRRPPTRPHGPCSTLSSPTGSNQGPTANSSDSARSCPGPAEHRPSARTRCSSGRTGPTPALAPAGHHPRSEPAAGLAVRQPRAPGVSVAE